MRWFAVAVLLTPAAGFGQTYYCDRPDEPYVPSGYTVEYEEITRLQDDVSEYVDEMSDYLECLKREHDDARSEADRVVSDWDWTVSQFNRR